MRIAKAEFNIDGTLVSGLVQHYDSLWDKMDGKQKTTAAECLGKLGLLTVAYLSANRDEGEKTLESMFMQAEQMDAMGYSYASEIAAVSTATSLIARRKAPAPAEKAA